MKLYGKMRFADHVAIADTLTAMIQCVTKLPDVEETIVGVTVQLIKPQAGYITGHIYRCSKDQYGNNYWKDVTQSVDIAHDESCHFTIQKVLSEEGRLTSVKMDWTTPESEEIDPWVRDVVVMKQHDTPLKLEDGIVCIGSVTANEYTSDKPFTLLANRTTGDYKFRVFHIFTSGRMTYTDENE